jgi:hypothetical protein
MRHALVPFVQKNVVARSAFRSWVLPFSLFEPAETTFLSFSFRKHLESALAFFAVLLIRIRIRIRIYRIHMFLGLPDPDPLVRGMDPDPDPALDPDPSIIMQK